MNPIASVLNTPEMRLRQGICHVCHVGQADDAAQIG